MIIIIIIIMMIGPSRRPAASGAPSPRRRASGPPRAGSPGTPVTSSMNYRYSIKCINNDININISLLILLKSNSINSMNTNVRLCDAGLQRAHPGVRGALQPQGPISYQII